MTRGCVEALLLIAVFYAARTLAMPTPHLFPGPEFTVDIGIVRFVPNPANDTSVNITLAATLAANTPTGQVYYRESSYGLATSETWLDSAANSSLVSSQWVGGQAVCFQTPTFSGQLSVFHDLTEYNMFVGFFGYKGQTVWQGLNVEVFSTHGLNLYISTKSQMPVGLWDNKGNIFTFTNWVTTANIPTKPSKCYTVSTSTSTRPAWWQDAATAAGVVAQDGAVPVLHGKSVYWLFGDSFLRKSAPACSWPGVSNTAMQVSADSSGTISASYYTSSSENNGCAWFIAPVTKSQWNPPHNRRIWPVGGTTVNGTAYVFLNVVDRINPGTAVGVSDASGPPTYNVLGSDSAGDYTQFPVNQPKPISYTPDANGYLYFIDWHVPAGFSDFNRYGRLSRVAGAQVWNNESYEFWTGSYGTAADGTPVPEFASTTDLNPAASPQMLYNVNNPQSSVTFNSQLGLYVLSTTETSQDIYMRVSPWATGPWSAHIPVYSHQNVPDLPNVYVYCAYQHPELSPPGSAMTWTFSRNGGGCGFPHACNDWMLHVTLQY